MTRHLPDRPNLEHLKHEAKAILKSIRSGVSTHTDLLRNVRRFSGISNKIYARIGYERVCDFNDYRFQGKEGVNE